MINSAFQPSEEHREDVVRKTDETIDSSKGLEMKRKIGLFSAVFLIVGSMIGSGIFITPGGVLQRSGSVGLSLVLWAACGLIAIFGSLCFAELGTLIPKSGGTYVYFMDGLGSLHPFWGPLPAFLYSWLSILLLNPSGSAASCLSVASYTVYPVLNTMGICLEPETEQMLIKLTAILFLGLSISINCFSVDLSLRIANTLTMAKLGAIFILILYGVHQLIYGNTHYLAEGFKGSTTDFGVIASALYGGLWAYEGWSSANFVTEELINPYVNLPRAIIIAIPLVTFCYLAINIAYLTVLSPERMISSAAVAVDMGNSFLGPMAFVIPLSVVLSIFGGMVGGMFTGARFYFASAREGHMVEVLSYIHVDSRTPVPALVFFGGLTVLFILANDVASLIDFFTFTLWIFYVLAMILLLILRKTRPDTHRPYKAPLFLPITIIIVGSYLIAAPIIQNPTIEYVYVLAAIFLGIVVYIPFVFYKYSPSFIAPVTKIIQLVLNVGPPVKPVFD